MTRFQRPLWKRSPSIGLFALTASLGLGCVEDPSADDESSSENEAAAKTVSFQNGASPSASYAGTTDAVILQSSATQNLGSDATLKADMDFPTGSAKAAAALLRFDLSSIPSGSAVSSVSLTVNVTNATSGEGFSLYAVEPAWDEATTTWNAAKSGKPWSEAGARGADRNPTPLGKLIPTATGTYAVSLNAAGVAVVRGWIASPSTNNGFVIDAPTDGDGLEFDSSESATASKRPRLSVAYTAPAAGGTGLQAQYFSGINFDTLKATRTDATVDFDWAAAAPSGTGAPADNFSARWTGEVLPAYSQTYTFTTRSDDGVRLWVNGKLLVDNWTAHSATENSGTIALTAGKKVAITLEYYEKTGDAVAQLSWSSPSVAKAIIPASALFPSGTTTPPVEPPPTSDNVPTWSAANPPAKVRTGESLLDNIPKGVPIIQASSYSSTRDFGELNFLIDANAPSAGYVQLDAGIYTISTMRNYVGSGYRGFINEKRKVLGWIGKVDANGNLLTKVRVAPNMISSSPGGVDAVLGSTKAAPTGGTAIYLSDTNASVPLFISGIIFQGSLQTPFSVYPLAASQGIKSNANVPSPLCFNGMAIWGAQPGSRVQFSKFEGFGFALTTAPPFEAGAVNTNRSNGLTRYRVEVDGRISADIDASRPRASGGWMQNKETLQTVDSSWDHHTRRSGYATNTNTNSTSEHYIAKNYLVEEIANAPDGWAGDSSGQPGFNGSNIEGVIGVFEYENVRFNVTNGVDFNWAIPYSGVSGVYEVPKHVVLKIKNHTTNVTTFGGLTRVSTSKQPNSTGISPIWNYIQTNGIASANDLIDVRDANNVRKTPVAASTYNAAIHKPATHYILTSF